MKYDHLMQQEVSKNDIVLVYFWSKKDIYRLLNKASYKTLCTVQIFCLSKILNTQHIKLRI